MRFLKAKLLPLLTLMLCAGVFSFPARASGASAPAALAWITGDTLYIEARGGRGGD